jgi:glycosyltransferase involved in cell wall biosynthesis
MKIAILTSSFPRYSGDFQGNFIWHHAQGQVHLGHEVHIICPHIPEALFHETKEGLIIHRFPYFFPYRYQSVTSDSGMYSALTSSFLALVQVPLFLVSEFVFSWRIVRKYQIDIIHSHWFIPSGLVGALGKFFWKKPYIISSHVLDANVFGKFRFLLPILKSIIASADLITTNSSYTKTRIDSLVSPAIIPCRIIPMGVNLQKINLGKVTRYSKKRILFVGRLVAWKGIDTLIRSMQYVQMNLPESELSIVGEGPANEALKDLAANLGLCNVIRFHGHAEDNELTLIYDSASVLVLPSRSYDGLVMEGLGVVLLEAMAHGVPVIGSNLGGIPDIIQDGENGFLFPPDDDKILGQKIVDLLSNERLAEQFRLAGYETVQSRFSWDTISQQFADVYNQVLH